MRYEITIERVAGFNESREKQLIDCDNDAQAIARADTMVRTCGELATLIDIELVETA